VEDDAAGREELEVAAAALSLLPSPLGGEGLGVRGWVAGVAEEVDVVVPVAFELRRREHGSAAVVILDQVDQLTWTRGAERPVQP
jgi:hypothetical protein